MVRWWKSRQIRPQARARHATSQRRQPSIAALRSARTVPPGPAVNPLQPRSGRSANPPPPGTGRVRPSRRCRPWGRRWPRWGRRGNSTSRTRAYDLPADRRPAPRALCRGGPTTPGRSLPQWLSGRDRPERTAHATMSAICARYVRGPSPPEWAGTSPPSPEAPIPCLKYPPLRARLSLRRCRP